MIIKNEIGTRKIELIIVETEPETYPSFRIKINLTTEELKAEFNRSIWIALSDLEKFNLKLTELDQKRIGDEKLKSMSPDEFYLRFRNIDKLGHLSVELKLKKSSFQKDYSDSIKVEFEIDPTTFPKTIEKLNEFKNVCQQRL